MKSKHVALAVIVSVLLGSLAYFHATSSPESEGVENTQIENTGSSNDKYQMLRMMSALTPATQSNTAQVAPTDDHGDYSEPETDDSVPLPHNLPGGMSKPAEEIKEDEFNLLAQEHEDGSSNTQLANHLQENIDTYLGSLTIEIPHLNEVTCSDDICKVVISHDEVDELELFMEKHPSLGQPASKIIGVTSDEGSDNASMVFYLDPNIELPANSPEDLK